MTLLATFLRILEIDDFQADLDRRLSTRKSNRPLLSERARKGHVTRRGK